MFQQRTVWRPVPGLEHAASQTLRLAVAYEDNHLAVVVKPQGMPTQVTSAALRRGGVGENIGTTPL